MIPKDSKADMMRKMRQSLILSFICIFISAVPVMADSVSEDAIFEGDTFSVADGGSLDIFNYSLNFVLDADGENIFVDVSDSEHYAIIPLDSCKDIDLIELCFERASGSTIYATMFTRVPYLTFETSIDSDESLVGEVNTFTANITNEGKMDSKETTLNISIPESIHVEYIDGGELQGDQIQWEGNLPSDETHTVTIEFLHSNATSADSIDAELIYDNYVNVERLYQTIEFSAEEAFSLDMHTEPEDLYLGTPFQVFFNLTNTYGDGDQDNVTFNKLAFPLSKLPGLVSHEGFVAATSKNLFWSGRLGHDRSKTFSMKLDPSSSGTHVLPLEMSFNDTSDDQSEERSFRYRFPLEVLSRDILVNLSVKDGEQFNSSRWYEYNITLTNTDDVLEFNNLNITFTADGHSDSRSLESLSPDETHTISNIPFLALASSDKAERQINASVTYENDFGEEKQRNASVSYHSVPSQEAVVRNEIEPVDEGSYELTTYVKNIADVDVEDISVEHNLHDDVFFTGVLNGTQEMLEPGEEGELSSFRISAAGLNFSADDYMFNTSLHYDVMDTERSFVSDENLTGMIYSLYDDPGVLEKTREKIERYFTSTTVFGIFVLAIFLVIVSVTTVALNKRRFSISGYDSLERKQHSLEHQKEHYQHKENTLEKQKRRLQGRIKELSDFMTKTRRIMERQLPVIDEKKGGLKTRQEELLEEKRLIDQKISELKEIEERLAKRNHQYQKELKDLDIKEKDLKERFEKVKARLALMNKEMERLLNKEERMGKKKEELNKKELGIIAEKQRVIKMGSEKFSNEKIDVVQEKIQLQHEKNVLEEELHALSGRKQDIDNAQQAIHRQKSDLEKEKNIFDMNKEAVESSLQVLKSQSDKINDILKESRETYIDEAKGENTKQEEISQRKNPEKSSEGKKKRAGKGSDKQKNS
ncbi:MAG: hypothetical protein ACLFTR_04900 [Candidatus Woesearchaeota archaeon]